MAEQALRENECVEIRLNQGMVFCQISTKCYSSEIIKYIMNLPIKVDLYCLTGEQTPRNSHHISRCYRR
jgi:hypothetical protein